MRRAALVIALVSVLWMGCAQLQTDWTDIPDSDIAQRNTFTVEKAAIPDGLSAADQTFWQDRRALIHSVISQNLTAKGYREVAVDPQFIVRFWAKRGTSYAQKYSYSEPKGTLDIRAVDPVSNKWLWHGWANKTLPAERTGDELVREAVEAIMATFPKAG